MENEEMPIDGNPKPNAKGKLPAADVDFGQVAKNVATAWTERLFITLIWTTAAEFTAEATAYNTELTQRKTVGGDRPQITNALINIDQEIDDSLLYVKGYILDKYKKSAAKSYYAAFGIVHKNNKYIFPIDRNNRLSSLELMLTGLTANGFEDKEYGKDFWEAIKTQYEALLALASTSDGTVSTKVSSKNTYKESLKKKMNALINVLMGNYPDTYKAELRAWGFQKEKY